MSRIPADIAAALQKWSDDIDAHLKKGECPQCQKHITAERDVRQAGATRTPGTWVKYRCPSCHYAIDVTER